MVNRWFEATVSALAYELGSRHGETGDPTLLPPYNDVARFVLLQHEKMPVFLGLPMKWATLAFSLAGVCRGGSVFHRLNPRRRRLQIEMWEASVLAPCRDVMKFYSSLAILGLYARLSERMQAAPRC
jgi:hypothetical protein